MKVNLSNLKSCKSLTYTNNTFFGRSRGKRITGETQLQHFVQIFFGKKKVLILSKDFKGYNVNSLYMLKYLNNVLLFLAVNSPGGKKLWKSMKIRPNP